MVCAWLTGCPERESSAPVEAPAVMVVENHTTFTWRVFFVPTKGKAANDVTDWQTVAPREVKKWELPAGLYRVGREALADAATLAPDATAREGIELKLEAGRIYTWPLGTLFSSDGVEP